MPYELIEGENWKRTLKFTVEPEEAEKRYMEALKQARRLFVMPGFRPGRVPFQIVEKRLGEQIVSETVETIREEEFKKAVEEKGLKVLGSPAFDEEEPFEKGKPYRFTVEFEVEPDFELPDYKGVKVERYTVKVDEKDIEAELDSMRYKFARWVEVEDRAAREKDAVHADIAVLHEGVEIARLENHRFVLRENAFREFDIDGLVEKLSGVKAGDEREVLAVLTENFEDGSKAGEEVTLRFTVKKVDALEMPELDDEFAAKMGYDSLDSLRADIAARIEQMRLQSEEQRFRRSVVDKVIEKLDSPLPSDFLARQTEANYHRTRMRYLRMGIDIESLQDGKHIETFRENAEADAERGIKELFLFERIAEKEKIFVTESEVENEIRELAAHYGISPVKMKSELEKEGLTDQLRWDILERKVVDFLVKHADVTEVDGPAPEPGERRSEAPEETAEESAGEKAPETE